MKRFLMVIGVLSILAGISYAVITPGKTDMLDYCTGPNEANCIYKLDNIGNVTAAGTITSNSGAMSAFASVGLTPLTTTQISVLVPSQTGQIIDCSNCATFNGGLGGLCISSGTTVGSFIQISSATAVSVCK